MPQGENNGSPTAMFGNLEAGKQVYIRHNCGTCHTKADVGGAIGKIGPDHTDLDSRAAESARFAGVDSPEAYVRQSIVDPNAYMSQSCPQGSCSPNVMPKDYTKRLSEQELNDLIAFLLYRKPRVDVTRQVVADISAMIDDGEIQLPGVEPLELQGEIRVAGSPALFPLTEAMVQRFYDDGFVGMVKNESLGSAAGIQQLCETTQADVATTSRPITSAEQKACTSNGRKLVEFSIGMDTLAVIVHSDNAFVDSVTPQELVKLFTRERWSDVNPDWPARDIEHYIAAPDTATFEFFVDAVFDGEASVLLSAPNARPFDNPIDLAEGVSYAPFSVGFISYAFYRPNAKRLKLLAIQGVKPTLVSVSQDAYPLTRPLFMYTDSQVITAKSQVGAFLNFYLTHVNEEITNVGYFPIAGKTLDEAKVALLQSTVRYHSHLIALGLAPEPSESEAVASTAIPSTLPGPDGDDILTYILQTNPYASWGSWPADQWNDSSMFMESGSPHGWVIRIYVNDIALQAAAQPGFDGMLPPGSFIIKENYMNKDVKNPGVLDHLTLMYKYPEFNPRANDWFWLMASPTGRIRSAGKGARCIACHGRLNNHDYLLRYGFGARPAVPSMRELFREEAESRPSARQAMASNDPERQTPAITPEMLSAFAPLPAEASPHTYEMTEALITLGRQLFYETRMSSSQDTSCNSCHPLDNYGVDNMPRSFSLEGKPLTRNSPTVYNAALHSIQLWDGRAKDVEAQAILPIIDSHEMGMPDPKYVEQVLRSIPGYADLFAAAFPGDDNPITFQNVGTALGAFERRLMTPSRFDKFLEGDKSQLSVAEQRGLATFIELGCSYCHQGPALGGGGLEKLGVHEPYETKDTGLHQVTGEEQDKYVFKVPGLRNITETGPYLHDGSIDTLEEILKIMGKHQLGLTLSDAQIADLITFLAALTGELPMDYIAEPILPESGPNTPAPKR